MSDVYFQGPTGRILSIERSATPEGASTTVTFAETARAGLYKAAVSGAVSGDTATILNGGVPYDDGVIQPDVAGNLWVVSRTILPPDVEVTVDSAEIAQLLSQTLTGGIQVSAPITPRGELRLTRGMDYLDADSRAAEIIDTTDSWPDLTGAALYLVIKETRREFPQVTFITGTVVTSNTNQRLVQFEITAAQSALLTQQNYIWGAYATLTNGHRVDLVRMGKNLTVSEMPLAPV